VSLSFVFVKESGGQENLSLQDKLTLFETCISN